MKKILIVNNLLGYYGAENVLKNMVNNLNPNEYDITVLTLRESSKFGLNDNVTYKYIFSGNNTLGSKIKNKIKYILGYKHLAGIYGKAFDIGIAFKMGECAQIVGNMKCKKRYCWIHSNVSHIDESCSYSFGNIEEEKHFLKKFDSMIAVSESCKRSFEEKYGKNLKTKVIFNPVDAYEIKEKAKEEIAEKEVFEGKIPIIGTVARLQENQKKLSRLIHISVRLKKEGIAHKLVLVGGGAEYQQYLKETQNEEQIYLCGFQKNPYKYMAEFDLFVCSSIWESYSIVVNEALVLGIPVISTKCGGPEEVLGHGEFGELVENNEDALYNAIKNFLTKKSYKKSKEYDADLPMKRFVKEVTKLLEGQLENDN